MKLVKVLNIKGALLDEYQLENYLEKIASDHVLDDKSQKETYPIPRLKENFEFITKTYELLNQDLKLGVNIHPAGEWLLDNYYIIEEICKGIEKELPLSKYTKFMGISTGAYSGFAKLINSISKKKDFGYGRNMEYRHIFANCHSRKHTKCM